MFGKNTLLGRDGLMSPNGFLAKTGILNEDELALLSGKNGIATADEVRETQRERGLHHDLDGGATADAIVTSVQRPSGGMVVHFNYSSGDIFDVGLRVHFDDGTTTDITRRIGGIVGTDLSFAVGDIVPVRYDPADRTHVEVDEGALRARQQQEAAAASQKRDDAAIQAAEARLRRQRNAD